MKLSQVDRARAYLPTCRYRIKVGLICMMNDICIYFTLYTEKKLKLKYNNR